MLGLLEGDLAARDQGFAAANGSQRGLPTPQDERIEDHQM
jgi:hypothetical protein